MSLARCLALALAAPGIAGGQGQALDAELLVAHPGLLSGDYDRVREDWLAALEADPASPLAADALGEIAGLDEMCTRRLDPHRLLALLPRLTDGHASLRLRRTILSEWRARRFSDDPLDLDPDLDLFEDLVGQWRVLGPFGPLDHPAPLGLSDPDAPEHGVRPTHPSAFGPPLPWRSLRRARNQLFILPARHLEWTGSGLGYLLAHLRVPAGVTACRLEILASEPFQAYWNGELAMDAALRAPHETGERFLAAVTAAPGWNALLLRFENLPGTGLAARLLDGQGRVLRTEELDGDAPLPPAVEPLQPPRRPPPQPLPSPGFPPSGGWGELGGFERVLWMLRQVTGGRPDRALAAPGPDPGPDPGPGGGGSAHAAWLRARFTALDEARHLPRQVQRRLQLEVESALEAAGAPFPEVAGARALRMIDEDRPAEALARAQALVGRVPGSVVFPMVEIFALRALDPALTLARGKIEALLADHPGSVGARMLLLAQAQQAGDLVGARDQALAALKAGATQGEVQGTALELLARSGGPDLEWAQRRLVRWAADEPANPRPRQLQRLVAETRGDVAEVERLLRAEVAARPGNSMAARGLTRFLVEQRRGTEALARIAASLERVPGDHAARGAASLLGQADPAERFFARFGPDREEALAASASARDASIAEALDSGMIYLFPDGASHQRFHTITLALDRKGTELLHRQGVVPQTRLARVLKGDGTVLEPMEVDGTWVMPTLEPGDAVELVVDRFTPPLPGTVPDLGWWRFSSFEKPFVRSRWVLYEPDGLKGELRTFHFDGEHETWRWEGGTVHVYLARDQPRRKEEVLRPSYEEILPWLQYGSDRPLGWVAAPWRERIAALSRVPADLEDELRGVVAEIGGGLSPRQRAAALYRRVATRVLDYSGSGRAGHVWTLRRGNPIFLLGTLYALAGVPFEWGVLERGVAPELDRAPLEAFAHRRGFEVPVLRIAGSGDEAVTWLVSPAERGLRFGSIPDGLAGARVLMLGEEGTRFEELPRDQLADSWDLNLRVTYQLGDEGAATVSGTLRMTSAQGAVLREQIAQIGEARRGEAARSLAGQLVPGLDLASFRFPGLDERGGHFELGFEGSLPGLVQSVPGGHQVDLRLPPSGLATGLGTAQRTWPLALRTTRRTRVHLRVDPGQAWRVVSEPRPFREEREGFLYALETATEGGAFEATRTLVVRGLVLDPDQVPAFLDRTRELEDEERRPLRLERVP